MDLPKAIADLLAAQDKYDSKAFAEAFSEDAMMQLYMMREKRITAEQKSGSGMK